MLLRNEVLRLNLLFEKLSLSRLEGVLPWAAPFADKFGGNAGLKREVRRLVLIKLGACLHMLTCHEARIVDG